MFRIVTSLLLILACTSVSAREASKHSANGGGGACSDVVASKPDHASASAKPAAHAARPASGTPAKPVSQRGGDASAAAAQTPRWHSFLPGMFR